MYRDMSIIYIYICTQVRVCIYIYVHIYVVRLSAIPRKGKELSVEGFGTMSLSVSGLSFPSVPPCRQPWAVTEKSEVNVLLFSDGHRNTHGWNHASIQRFSCTTYNRSCVKLKQSFPPLGKQTL